MADKPIPEYKPASKLRVFMTVLYVVLALAAVGLIFTIVFLRFDQ